MAVANGYGKVVTSGSVFMYDTGDTVNSYKGRPTTNLVGTGMSIYNNVPGSVNATLTETSETYMGAPVWIQTLTPTDANGVSWLSYGNNPGIGVVHGGGGGTANRYTGFSIFFKSTVPMNSVPIFLAYSNIGGWQCNTCPPEDMGDGWYRAKVLWYDTVTRVDGKYWAINPLLATLNVPITIYWAGPFKEDLNSQIISQYTLSSRSVTQGLLPLVGNSSIDLSNVSFDSNVQIIFDGTDDFIPLSPSIIPTNQITIEFVCTNNSPGSNNSIIAGGANQNQDLSIHLPWGDGGVYWDCGRPFNRIAKVTTLAERTGVHHWVFTKNPSTGVMNIYLDGNLWHTGTGLTSTMPSLSSVSLGRYDNGGFAGFYYNGTIPVAKIYDREISAAEVKQNYNKYKTRFNLP
jgi:hypothetical protein